MNGDTNVNCDAIVISGKPADLSAALMLGRSRRRVLVVDAGVLRKPVRRPHARGPRQREDFDRAVTARVAV